MRHADRVVVVYTTPLGDTVFVRTGLGPTGPWSPARALARCRLAEGAFCGGLGLHPALAPEVDPGEPLALVVSYGVAAFEDLPRASRLTRWTRLGP